MTFVHFISHLHKEPLRRPGRKSRVADKKSNLSPWYHLNQLLSSFISRTIIGLLWFVWFLFWGPFLFTRLWTEGGVGRLCGGGGSPSFLSTWDPVDNPGPAHCIECAATVSTVMLVNNSYSWNPLRWLLTVCDGRPGSFLDDLKWQQSLSTLENLHISASATHLQKEPQVLPEMVKV